MSSHKATNNPSVLSARQASELTGIATARTFQRWAREGKLAYVALPNGRKLFRREDVEALLVPTTESADEVEAHNEARSNESSDQPLPGFEEMG